MKRKILLLGLLILTVASLVCALAFTAGAESEEVPSVSIDKFNLVFSDNVYLKYAVKFDGVEDTEITADNVGMLYFDEPKDDYTAGGEKYSSGVVGHTTIDGAKYYTFEYRNLTAKQMTDYIYSVAYIELDGVRYYSEPVKYSVLDYAYIKLGLTGTASTNESFKNMLRSMLAYGADAQIYFDYKTDRLADATYYQVNVVGGKLDDGYTSGLYLPTDTVTVTADEADEGLVFAEWQNSTGATVSTDDPMILTEIGANETYTAIFSEAYSQGLAYTVIDDTTCMVSGIGTCTDTDIVIPSTAPDGRKVVSIGDSAFENNDSITSLLIPESITSIGDNAFADCIRVEKIFFNAIAMDDLIYNNYVFEDLGKNSSGVTVVIGKNVTKIPASLFSPCFQASTWSPNIKTVEFENGSICTSIGDYAFALCTSIISIEIPDTVTSIGRETFSYCTGLMNIEIPDGVTNIGQFAFYNCSNLQHNRYDNAYYLGNVNTPYMLLVKVIDKSLTSCIISEMTKFIDNAAFSGCTGLTSIDIPDSVTSLGDSAFSGCTNLTNASLGKNISSIGDDTFNNCTKLISIVIPDSVKSIGEKAFLNCIGLKSITIGKGVSSIDGDYSFSGCTAIETIYYNATNMNDLSSNWNFDHAGQNSDGIKVVIGKNVTQIPKYLFNSNNNIGNSPNIKTVEFEEGSICQSIGEYAFYHCNELTSIEIPKSLTDIGSHAFGFCTNIEKIHFNAVNMKDLGYSKNVFSGAGETTDKTTIIIGNNVNKIPSYLFCNANVKNVIFEKGSVCTSIGASAFRSCINLKRIDIPDSIANIDTYAFYNCDALEDVYITDVAAYCNISYGSSYANPLSKKIYLNGNLIVDLEIPEGVISIPSNAFRNQSNIKTISIPSSVTSIGSYSFYNCTKLMSVELGEGVESIDSNAFNGCDKLVEVINKSSLNISVGSSSYGFVAKNAKIVHTGETLINNIDDYLFITSEGVNYLFNYIGEETKLVLPSSYNGEKYVIDRVAFIDNTRLTKVVIPDNVTSIGYSAFKNCFNLASVTIGSRITSIAWDAFDFCYKLVEVVNKSSLDLAQCGSVARYAGVIHSDETLLVTIDDYLFITLNGVNYLLGYTGNNTELSLPENYYGERYEIYKYAFYKCTDLTSIEITSGVRSIGFGAFDQCIGLKNVLMTDSVASIESAAFDNCSSLTNIYYTGTEEEWNAITIGSGNNPLTNATKHYEYQVDN